MLSLNKSRRSMHSINVLTKKALLKLNLRKSNFKSADKNHHFVKMSSSNFINIKLLYD